ncbi:hypothetical protein BCEN4_700024 [Burkholderia cenocepacia]|nr:hypothetical protein BCEN4_700024 [Burkholderia cenocepacia]
MITARWRYYRGLTKAKQLNEAASGRHKQLWQTFVS